MSDCGRNGLCGCGSGKKAKRCCGVRRGPGPRDLAKAFLAEQARMATARLLPVHRSEFDELFDEVVDLPAVDISLQLRLPGLMSPELASLRAAIDDGDHDRDGETLQDLVAAAVHQLDTPERRAELGRAVLATRDAGRINARVSAVAMIDLNLAASALFASSLLRALAVLAGVSRTPSGLIVAAR